MPAIYLRSAQQQDMAAILQIIHEAKVFLKAAGNPQWQDGHPNQDYIQADIDQHNGYVLMHNYQVVGYSALVFAPDPSYAHLKNGTWQNADAPYAVIHRTAISAQYRGQKLSKFLFSNLLSLGIAQKYHNFRIDTHAVNQPMQHLIADFGFQKRGQVLVSDKIDPLRDVFELNL